MKYIFTVIVALNLTACDPTALSPEERQSRIDKYESVPELAISEVSKLGKLCVDGGMKPRPITQHLNMTGDYRRKTVGVRCVEIKNPMSTGEGIVTGAAIGTAGYLAKDLLK